jgi:hypothetical protein
MNEYLLGTICQNFQHILFTQCFGDDVREVIILPFSCPICSSLRSSVSLSFIFIYLICNTKLQATYGRCYVNSYALPITWDQLPVSQRKGGNHCMVQWMWTRGIEMFWHWKLRSVHRAFITLMVFLIEMRRLCEVRATILYFNLISLMA